MNLYAKRPGRLAPPPLVTLSRCRHADHTTFLTKDKADVHLASLLITFSPSCHSFDASQVMKISAAILLLAASLAIAAPIAAPEGSDVRSLTRSPHLVSL